MWLDTQFEEPERESFVKLDMIGDFIEGTGAGVAKSSTRSRQTLRT